jgi:hypothetical protein
MSGYRKVEPSVDVTFTPILATKAQIDPEIDRAAGGEKQYNISRMWTLS